jgi:general secretion pathway protein A
MSCELCRVWELGVGSWELRYASSGLSVPSNISQMPMYEEFYGFVQPPFTLAPDPRFLYRSESHDEAITGLLQAIRRREGFIVLAGDIGTGKTTVCRALLQQLDTTTFTSLILNPFLSVEELLREILLDFGVVSRDAVRSGRLAAATKHELISTLHEFLLSLIAIRGSGVLIIDEAQHLSPEVLEQIRVISNMETNESKLLQIVLVGQLNLLDALGDAQMRQLDQRVSLRALLKPLTRDEVEAYIAHRLSVASSTTAVTFESGALDLVHEYSGGVPRVINLLCDRALMIAAESRLASVTSDIIRSAAGRLDLKLPQADTKARWLRMRTRAAVAAGILAVLIGVMLFAPLHRLVDVTPPAPPREIRPVVAQPIPVPAVPNVTVPLPPNL